jgi:hypothetical protein
VHRIAWDLRGDAPPAAAGAARGRRGGAGAEVGADVLPEQDQQPVAGRGRQSGPPSAPGRYRATLGKQSGDTVTAIGQPQTFLVVPLAR